MVVEAAAAACRHAPTLSCVYSATSPSTVRRISNAMRSSPAIATSVHSRDATLLGGAILRARPALAVAPLVHAARLSVAALREVAWRRERHQRGGVGGTVGVVFDQLD